MTKDGGQTITDTTFNSVGSYDMLNITTTDAIFRSPVKKKSKTTVDTNINSTLDVAGTVKVGARIELESDRLDQSAGQLLLKNYIIQKQKIQRLEKFLKNI